MDGQKVRLVLADDNQLFCRELKQREKEYPQIEIAAQAANGQLALQRTMEARPDVLVLDMFLPLLDGVGVLRVLRDRKVFQETRVLALCGAGQDHMVDLAFSAGADYVLTKPFSIALFVQRVMDLAEGRIPFGVRMRDRIIAELLGRLDMPTSVLGYQYLCEAIRLASVDESLLHNITGRLYPKLADIFCSTPSRVERSIRHAIELSMQCAQPDAIAEVLGEFFVPPQDRPPNGRFIAILAKKAQMRHMNPDTPL